MDRHALLTRARTRGVNPLVYWVVRAILQPFFHVYFRLGRIGREHIPGTGPVILASNHRSFLDPFVIAVMARRPIYFVAKKELFAFHPVVSWLLGALGAFPIDRGASDQQAMATARAILERGEVVLMFPEGTRVRPGALGIARRGVGRLALETGAPVVPVAVIGTEAVRRGRRIRPHRVRIRAGRALTFPRVPAPSPALAAAVTDRIWPCVELQWEWLGGLPRPRRAAVIGAGPAGTSLAAALARAGLEVELAADADRPGAPPAGVRSVPAAELDLTGHDLVCFAVAPRDLPAALNLHGERIPERAAVLVLSAPPVGAVPVGLVGEHVRARGVAALGAAGPLAAGEPLVLACADRALLATLGRVLRAAGLRARRTTDVSAAWPAELSAPTRSHRRSRAA
jgi:glycerol-3-phosphate dehydrogenase (NAD(P)+)